MGGIVCAVLLVISTITLSEARHAKPKIDVYEIRTNQENDVNLQPAKLQYDLNSKESSLTDLIYPQKHDKVNLLTRDVLKRLQNLKTQDEEPQKEPLVLILTSNRNIINELLTNTAQNIQSVEDEGDYTRAEKKKNLHNIILFPDSSVKKSKKIPLLLRSEYNMPEDRTAAPRHRYVYDRK